MAWHLEKHTGDIVITFPEGKGTAPDPYSGMNRMYQVNLTVPNEVSVGYPVTTSTTSGGTLGVPCSRSVAWFASYGSAAANGSPSFYDILDASGQVYQSTSMTGTFTFLSSSNSTSGSSSRDSICHYLGYLFKFRNGSIDYWDGSTWHTAWQSITAGVPHFSYVGTDNILYFCNGNYIGSIGLADPSTPTSFDPTSAPTYTFSATKLQLPQTDWAISIGEVGGGNTPQSTLLVGGLMNAIYPWDKTSTSFNYPIFMADNYAARIVSANQNAFIFAGKSSGRGRIFITNGSQAEEYFKMPDYIFGVQDPYYTWGDAIYWRNNLLFGAFIIPNTQASPLLISQLWALDLDTKAFRSISEIPASATAKGNATALMGVPNSGTSGFSYIIGWDDNGSAPGIGYSGTTAGTGASATITTDLIPVGTFLKRKTFKQIEVKFRSPLASGESLTVTPIIDASTQSAANLTFSPTLASGGNNTFSATAPVTFEANQWLQFSMVLAGNSASSGARLHEIRLR